MADLTGKKGDFSLEIHHSHKFQGYNIMNNYDN